MTKETLLKFKEIYEKNGDKKQLAKVLNNLAKYEEAPNILDKIAETKSKGKK